MKILVLGSSGFIGSNLVKNLRSDGNWVRAVSHSFHDNADMYLDLRNSSECHQAFAGVKFDEVYQLAADMGGIGHITNNAYAVMRNNILINTNVVNAAINAGVKKYFFSSSACVYKNAYIELTESDAYPAMPDNEYGWEKLFSERLLLNSGLNCRIARFGTTYGHHCIFEGGKEKSIAAICRKVAMAKDYIEVWGDGSAVRSFLYIDDLINGIQFLMDSDYKTPVNIGSSEYISIKELSEMIIKISGKNLSIKYIDGPVGVSSRNFTHSKIHSLGWIPSVGLKDGLARTYNWINKQING